MTCPYFKSPSPLITEHRILQSPWNGETFDGTRFSVHTVGVDKIPEQKYYYTTVKSLKTYDVRPDTSDSLGTQDNISSYSTTNDVDVNFRYMKINLLSKYTKETYE